MGQIEKNQATVDVQHTVSSNYVFYSTKKDNRWVEFENFYSDRNCDLDKAIGFHYSGSSFSRISV